MTNTEITVFVYSAGKLVAEYSTELPSNPTTSYVATDTLQSVRAISDKNGNIISRRDFMPFGEELYANTANRTTAAKYSAAGDDGIRQKFTGYEKDKETGLDFAEARYYNNAHGRFTAVDPLLASGKSANPQTFNRYVYVMNSPLINTDPTGLQTNQSKFWLYKGDVNDRTFIRASKITEQNKKEGYTNILTEQYETTIASGANKGKTAIFYPNGSIRILQLPFGKPKDSGFEHGTIEDNVTNMRETILSGVKATSDTIVDGTYKLSPDSCGVSCSVPLFGGFGAQVSKDFGVFGSYSNPLASDGGDFIEWAMKRGFKGGCKVGCTYFIPSWFADVQNPYLKDITPSERDDIIEGADLSLSGGVVSYEHSLDGGEPDAATIGVPFELGVGITNTKKLFQLNNPSQMYNQGSIFPKEQRTK